MNKEQEWLDSYFAIRDLSSDMHHTVNKLLAAQKVLSLLSVSHVSYTETSVIFEQEKEHLRDQIESYEKLYARTAKLYDAMSTEGQRQHVARQAGIYNSAARVLIDYVEKCCFSD